MLTLYSNASIDGASKDMGLDVWFGTRKSLKNGCSDITAASISDSELQNIEHIQRQETHPKFSIHNNALQSMKPHILPHVKVFLPRNSERNVFHNKYKLSESVFRG